MKTIKFYVIIGTLVFASVSCVEKSAKYQAIVAQRDSIEQAKIALDSSYNQSLTLLNDIETGFSEINYSASEMMVNLKGSEGKTTNKRALIAAQMTAIKENIEQNKAKIEELQQLASKNGRANTMLTETIKRLQTEMGEKLVQIQSLQAELDQKNIKINELTSTVDVQSKSIAEQQSAIEQQKSTIKSQDSGLNTVWYCVGTTKQLKEASIITTSGLFKATKKVMDNEFDNNAFTQVDLRNISTISTNSKKIKILSSHPKNTYNLVTGDDKTITIEITDPSKFWSVSRYLVVQI
ncbi:MAG TPA: hypothetical protein P5084_15645 [Paludibacter sp.]|nr:hypothetical protein [Paludibacter sp.]